jgi:hypothetical protein
MSNEMTDQEFLNTMTFEELNSYPALLLDIQEGTILYEEDILQGINRILNDSRYEDHVFVPGDYLRVNIGNDQTNVHMFKIKKCGIYLGTINIEQQYNDRQPTPPLTPPLTPPRTPPREGMAVVSPGGGKRKSKKNKKLNKRILTRKGGSGKKKLDLRITDENGQELFVPVIKDKNGNLTYSEDGNILASIRSKGVPPTFSSEWENFDTKALKKGGKSKKNKTKKKIH